MADEVPAPEGTPAPAAPMGLGGDPAPATPPASGNTPPPPAASITIPENWKDALPEEFRKEASMSHIKTIEDLSKSYIHAQKAIGRDKVVIPDPKFATDGDWKAFYQKLGLPADAKDYKVTPPKGMENTFEPEFLGEFAKTAMEMNILPAQANKLLEWYGKKEQAAGQAAVAQNMEQIKSNLEAYKQKMGQGYEKRVSYANRVIKEMGGPEVSKFFGSNPAIGANPQMIEFLSKVGAQMYGEDTFQGEGGNSGMTPEEARSERNEIMGNQAHPYWNAQHPNHQAAVERVTKLIQMENPGPRS